ncbi:hypothetical protein [Egicoccus sp. AB-alg6-2]|uniref:hypothetical protein n=1 Tax=Egicoccus sp. AB-alg6-2 TaxID=3242692 RepID=UPI00359D85B8
MRPLGVGDVLDGAITIFRRCFKVLAVIVLLVQGPYQLASALVLDRFLPELGDEVAFERFFENTVPVELLARLLLVGGSAAIVGLLVHVLAGGAVAAAIRDFDHGGRVRAGDALRASFAVSGATLGASVLLLAGGMAVAFVLIVALTVLGFAVVPLAVVLGILAVPVLLGAALALGYLVIPIAVLEETGPVQTLGRAWWVLRRRFWWVLGATSLALLLVAALSFGFGIAMMLVSLVAGPAAAVVEAVFGTLSAMVSVPLTIAAAQLIHHDARVRAEGYDLRVRAQHGGGF